MKRATSTLGTAAIILTLSATLLCSAQEQEKDASDAPETPSARSVKSARVDRSDDVPIVGRKRVAIKQSALDESEEGVRLEREIIGREIADYRTPSGGGKYAIEDEYGFLRTIPAAAIKSIDDAPDATLGELREACKKRLLAEFGEGFSVKTTDRYLFVYNSSDGYAEWCARLFDNLADGFQRYADKNGFDLKERLEPMTVVVFAAKSEFVRYASNETPGADQIAAYYNLETNRVVLYDLSETEGTGAAATRRRRTFQETKEYLSRPNAAFNVATIVHEATHQVAYNRGLFQRTGPFALWTAEGLSLLFETPNGKASQGGWGYRSVFPVNERQLAIFREVASRTSQKDALRDLIRQDKFMVDLRASYATSWALFHYLYKKRPKELAEYMREIANKPPFTVYSPEDRIADFEKYFGNDWEKLTENLLKFVKRL